MKVTLSYGAGSDVSTWLSSVKHLEKTEVLTYLDGLERQALNAVTMLMREIYIQTHLEWSSSKREAKP